MISRLLQPGQVSVGHDADQLLEGHRRLPTEQTFGLAGLAHQQIHLCRAVELGINHHVLFPIQPYVIERDLAKLADRVGFTGRDQVVIRVILLEHQPHGMDIVGRVSPVAPRFQVAQAQFVLHPQLDTRHRVGDLARDEFQAAARDSHG